MNTPSHLPCVQVVTCKNPALRKRIVSVLQMAQTTISSLASSFRSTSYTLEKPEKVQDTSVTTVTNGVKSEVNTEKSDVTATVKMEA
jgi:hypothetical protein